MQPQTYNSAVLPWQVINSIFVCTQTGWSSTAEKGSTHTVTILYQNIQRLPKLGLHFLRRLCNRAALFTWYCKVYGVISSWVCVTLSWTGGCSQFCVGTSCWNCKPCTCWVANWSTEIGTPLTNGAKVLTEEPDVDMADSSCCSILWCSSNSVWKWHAWKGVRIA